MIKKTITYTDYNGVERTEDFYFNLSQAELVDIEYGTPGGYSNLISKIKDTKDLPGLLKIYKELIFKTYGEKSADGRRFIKNDELSKAFSETEAYTVLFMDMIQDAKKFADFVTGVMPPDLRNELVESKEYAEVQKEISGEKLIEVKK